MLALFMYLALPCFGGHDRLLLEGTEIYQPLGLLSLVVVEDRAFMVDHHGGRLLTFDGDQARVVMRKGEGPGELNRPSWIALLGDRIYLKDFGKVHVLDTQGPFRETIQLQSGIDHVGKLHGGFLCLSGLGYGQLREPSRLFFLSSETGERTTLASWAPEAERNPRAAQNDLDTLRMGLDLTFAWLGHDRKYAYVQVSGLSEVHIIDLEQGQIVEKLEVTGEPVRFDKKEGRQRLEAYKKRFGFEMKGDFPDHYPLIQNVLTTRENHLVIVKYSGHSQAAHESNHRDDDATLFYDRLGNPIEPNIFDLNYRRVAWLEGSWVWVNVYNEALDEHTVVRCHRDDFEAVIDLYPLSD